MGDHVEQLAADIERISLRATQQEGERGGEDEEGLLREETDGSDNEHRHQQVSAAAITRDDGVDENEALRIKLRSLRKKRRRLRDLRRREERLRESLQRQLNGSALRQEEALLQYQSACYEKGSVKVLLEASLRWNVVNDCFYIAARGPFATINGLRLGSEAPFVETGDVDRKGAGSAARSPPQQQHQPSRYFLFGSAESHQSGGTTAATSDDSSGTAAVRVPWAEINSALGQVALLLLILERKPHSGIRYRHQIIYQGSTSKIGIRRNGGLMGIAAGQNGHHHRGGNDDYGCDAIDMSTLSVYNLYSDDSFQFFGRRNFNTALECLAECVSDAAKAVQKRDRTIELPHEIERTAPAHSRAGGNITVGGLPVTYGQDGGPEWTRAMKYLLTDVKHLLTYRVLGLWNDGRSYRRPSSNGK